MAKKIKLTVEEIKCHEATRILKKKKDQAFYSISAISGAADANDEISGTTYPRLFSGTTNDMRDGSVWRPKTNHELILEVPDGHKVVAFSFALYEKDKGDVFKQLAAGKKELKVSNFTWKTLSDRLTKAGKAIGDLAKEVPSAIYDPKKLVELPIGAALKAIVELLDVIRGDDLIDTETFAVDFEGADWKDDGTVDAKLTLKGRADLGGIGRYSAKVSVVNVP